MITYRKISAYKYELAEDYSVATGIRQDKTIVTPFLQLNPDGLLIIAKGYAWDGASGYPDVPQIMRGALVHDALYQLMRLHHLDPAMHKQPADRLLCDHCLIDGMDHLTANAIYKIVQALGCHSATKHDSKDTVFTAP